MVPIPGTKQIRFLEENIGSVDVRLTDDDLARIDKVFPPGVASGTRYPEAAMRAVGR